MGALCAFRAGHRDARLLSAEFPGAVPEDLLELGVGECLTRIGTDWSAFRTLPPPPALPDDPTTRLIAATRALVSQPPAPPVTDIPVIGPETPSDDEWVR